MSTDYFLFVNSDTLAARDLPLLAEIDGVALDGGHLIVDGLVCTSCAAMSSEHREIMLEDYGEYGQEYTWYMTGTYDKKSCPNQLAERLARCAAKLVSVRPTAPLALMVNAESFYVLNSPSKLILSKACIDDEGSIPRSFGRPYTEHRIVNY